MIIKKKKKEVPMHVPNSSMPLLLHPLTLLSGPSSDSYIILMRESRSSSMN